MALLIIILLALLLLLYHYSKQKRAIKRWYHTLSLKEHHTHFHRLYDDLNGFILSKAARKERDAMEYTYGEIDFIAFIALIHSTKPTSETIFYDLGSGIGKAVLACAMVFNVKKSCGIELFDLLHQAALNQQQQLQLLPAYQNKATRICFIQGNFLEIDFSDATLIFINSTAFFGETWELLNQRLEQLNEEVIIITTTKKLISSQFQIIKILKVQMSWGIVTAYIHQKNRQII